MAVGVPLLVLIGLGIVVLLVVGGAVALAILLTRD
jgi:hypothetical protein